MFRRVLQRRDLSRTRRWSRWLILWSTVGVVVEVCQHGGGTRLGAPFCVLYGAAVSVGMDVLVVDVGEDGCFDAGRHMDFVREVGEVRFYGSFGYS